MPQVKAGVRQVRGVVADRVQGSAEWHTRVGRRDGGASDPRRDRPTAANSPAAAIRSLEAFMVLSPYFAGSGTFADIDSLNLRP